MSVFWLRLPPAHSYTTGVQDEEFKKKSHKVCVGSGIYTKPKVEPPPRQCSLVSLTFLSPLIKSVAALSNNININHSNIPVRGGWTEPGR